jgi:uncharacterized membrane protein HdeD (DUF308 family)
MSKRNAAVWRALVVIGMAPLGYGVTFLVYWYLLLNIRVVAMVTGAVWALGGTAMLVAMALNRRAPRVALPRAVASYGRGGDS